MSEATKFSPLPSPMTIGVAVFAASRRVRSSSERITIENEPCSRFTAARAADIRSSPLDTYSSTSCEITSVSVSELNRRPRDSSSVFSSTKFSMIPLWMTTILPARCGWAFSSEGRPCVAQRVWPMPIVPCSGFSSRSRARLSSLPTQRRTSILPPSRVASPAES